MTREAIGSRQARSDNRQSEVGWDELFIIFHATVFSTQTGGEIDLLANNFDDGILLHLRHICNLSG